jgi:hypothetical protein
MTHVSPVLDLIEVSKNNQNKSKKEQKSLVTKEQVQNMIRSVTPIIEQKYTDSVWSSYQPTYSFGGLSAITVPAQGTTRSTRVGDVLRWKSIEVRGQYYGAVSHVVRVILFSWHPATTPTGGDVLDGTYASSFRAPFAPYNITNKDMYSVYYDKMFQVSASGSQNDPIKFSKKVNIPSKFATGSSTGTNLLYILMIQDGVVTLGTIDMVVRCHFVDE